MSLQLYLVFVLATALLIATPGPNVALIVGTSLRHGTYAARGWARRTCEAPLPTAMVTGVAMHRRSRPPCLAS